MDYPILVTKLYTPPSRQDLVLRPRLVERLEKSLDGKLTLVSAPAGFGKTTLLSQWIGSSDIPFGWLSLDEQDNDLGRFLAYLLACLRSVNIPVDLPIISQMQSQPGDNIDTLLIPLINQLVDVDARFALVLDDYQLIQNEAIHKSVIYLLDHLPPNMHLVIVSRADPPLPLARLRARGQMSEIRTVDLRFSPEEAELLINNLQGLHLTTEDIKLLIDKTDGWIAALQMATIAMKNKVDASTYLRDFSGSRDYIADFLTEEVIDQQPEQIYDFLLKTSILDRLSGPLCDAVTQLDNCQHVLKQLRDTNLFLVSLDDASQWFRYHRLFSDLLNQRLLEAYGGEVPALYCRASEWFEQHDYPEDAILYATSGQDYHRAATLIELQAEQVLMRSEIATFVRWVSMLPEEVIFQHGMLCLYYAWALLINGAEPSTAQFYLDQVDSMDPLTSSRVAAVQSILEFYRRELPNSIEHARNSLQGLPVKDYFFRQIAAWNLSALLFISGDHTGGAEMLEEVARVSLENGNLMVAIVALSRLGSYHMQFGDLDQAEELFRRAIHTASKDPARPLPAACEAMLGLGKIFWERYQFEAAADYLNQGIKLSIRWREITAINAYVTFAMLKQSLNEPNDADQMIAKAQKLAADYLATENDDRFVASQKALLNLRRGQIEQAQRWAHLNDLDQYRQWQNLDAAPRGGRDIILRYALLVYARLLIAQDQPDEALKLLDLIYPSLEKLGHTQQVLEALILRAIGWHALGDSGNALSSLSQAIYQAEVAGYRRIFLDEGQIIEDLVREAINLGLKSRFASELLDAFSKLWGSNASTEVVDLIEPLSDREIEVLHLLRTELTGPEIADRLIISVSTFRTHVKNIYAKLDVHSRYEAVARADELGLV